MFFFETSAKTGKNIEEIFMASINEINQKINKNLYELSNEVISINISLVG
jgi:GTPase SAR1 family protein